MNESDVQQYVTVQYTRTVTSAVFILLTYAPMWIGGYKYIYIRDDGTGSHPNGKSIPTGAAVHARCECVR